MSNPMFENPKVALGFSGVVVAVALVASVAFKEFSPSDASSGEAIAEQQQVQAAPAVSQQPQAGFAPAPATGWAGDAGATDDWGAPVAASQGGFAEVPEQTNDAPVFGDHVSRTVSNGATDPSGGPKITSRAAPGAPEVRPPQNGPQAEIAVKGS